MRNLDSLMHSFCSTDFYFSFSEFYMVTYVTDFRGKHPSVQHANISYSTQLEMLF